MGVFYLCSVIDNMFHAANLGPAAMMSQMGCLLRPTYCTVFETWVWYTIYLNYVKLTNHAQSGISVLIRTQACGMLGSHWAVPVACCWPVPPNIQLKEVQFPSLCWLYALSFSQVLPCACEAGLLPENAFLGVPHPVGAVVSLRPCHLCTFMLWLSLALKWGWVSPSGLCCYNMIMIHAFSGPVFHSHRQSVLFLASC